MNIVSEGISKMSRNLTIIIPSHNDTDNLIRLLSRLAALRISQQIIVVDDCSSPKINHQQLLDISGLEKSQLQLLRKEFAHGAGAARNLALANITTSHLMFLDADDLPTRELRALWHTLANVETFDFCIFQHHDTRMSQEGLWGQMPFDQQFWKRANLEQGALRRVSEPAAQLLVQSANYPWNKIYRTKFLTGYNINFSEIPVHNDILFHWRSFIKAHDILSSDLVGVVHFVDPQGRRLTNQRGEERLQVFEPLERVANELAAERSALSIPFYNFALGLMAWAHAMISIEFQPRFEAAGRKFFHRYVSPQVQKELDSKLLVEWLR
jgi:glycosyltransferase involved in cell wall biosynthesis